MLVPHARWRWIAGGFALLAVAAAVVVVLLTGGDEARSGLSVDFTPTAGVPVAADEVRAEVVGAVDRLIAEPAVEIRSVGYTEGRRSDVEARVDVTRRRSSSIERISDGVDVGGPAADRPIVSELVVIGDEAWLRILQPEQPRDTPFQFIDATGLADAFLLAAYTDVGRVFDSPAQLSAVLAALPFAAERLGSATVDGRTVQGVRATFAANDVAELLRDRGFAQATEAEDGTATVFELWYDDRGLVELVATGVQFQDGEALETSARIRYTPRASVQIEAPVNTLAR